MRRGGWGDEELEGIFERHETAARVAETRSELRSGVASARRAMSGLDDAHAAYIIDVPEVMVRAWEAGMTVPNDSQALLYAMLLDDDG